MIKIQRKLNYVTIPSSFIDDAKLSLEAKGLLTWFYANKNHKTDFADILENNNLDKKKLVKVIQELSTNGYVVNIPDTDDLEVVLNQKKKKDEIVINKEDIETKEEKELKGTHSKKLSRWEQCEKEIRDYTDNKELQTALFDYVSMRLNPAPESRLKNVPLYASALRSFLKTLDTLKGDKVKIVQQSIIRSWNGFFELDENKNKVEAGEIKSSRYTKEEAEAIRKKASENDAKGERRSF